MGTIIICGTISLNFIQLLNSIIGILLPSLIYDIVYYFKKVAIITIQTDDNKNGVLFF